MPEKSPAFWIAVAITLFALFSCAMLLVAIMRVRRIERRAALEAEQKKVATSPKLMFPPKQILE